MSSEMEMNHEPESVEDVIAVRNDDVAEASDTAEEPAPSLDPPAPPSVPKPVPRSRGGGVAGPSAPPFPGQPVVNNASLMQNVSRTAADAEEVDSLRKELQALKNEFSELEQDLLKKTARNSCGTCENLQHELMKLKDSFKELKAGLRERGTGEQDKVSTKKAVQEAREESMASLVERFHQGCKDALDTEIGPIGQFTEKVRTDLDETRRIVDEMMKQSYMRDTLIWKVKHGMEMVTAKVVKETTSHLWIIDDFPGLVETADCIESSVFSTSRYAGYHLKAILFPGGAGSGVGTHVSVCWMLLPSDRDDYLEWPFQHRVKFTLIPPVGSSKSELPPIMASTRIGDGPAFQRPPSGAGPSVGDIDPARCEGIEQFVTADVFTRYVWPDGRLVLEVGMWPLSDVKRSPSEEPRAAAFDEDEGAVALGGSRGDGDHYRD